MRELLKQPRLVWTNWHHLELEGQNLGLELHKKVDVDVYGCCLDETVPLWNEEGVAFLENSEMTARERWEG